jgi:hypothetical protein
MDAVAAAEANNEAVPAIAQGYNGEMGDVDLSKPVDHVAEQGKVILDTNAYALFDNLKYQFWLVQGKPAAAVAVTEAQCMAFLPIAARVIARHRIYNMLHAAEIDIRHRLADAIPLPPNANHAAEFVARFADRVMTDEYAKGSIATQGQFILNSLIANGIHRAQNKGHNWFSEKGMDSRKNNPTARTLAVAGAEAPNFRLYMEEAGHDGNHSLSDETLEEICDALTGKEHPYKVVTAPNTMYLGEEVTGVRICRIYPMDEAAIDRWPPGVLGKSSLVVGVGMMQAMLIDMGTKAKIENTGHVSMYISNITRSLKDYDGNRDSFRRLENALGESISVTYGYVSETGIIDELQYQAFKKHAERYPAALAAGKSLANAIALATPHKEAVEGAICASINALTAGLAQAAAVVIPGATNEAGRAMTYSTAIQRPTRDVRVTVGEDQGAALVRAMTQRGGGGDVFYNAEG